MTTEKHTPLAFGAPLTADTLNAPLGQLDSAIVGIETALAGTSLALTVTDAVATAGQKVVPVASTDAFVVGQPVWIGDVGGVFEVGTIASIQAGVSLTMVANLVNTYAAGKVVSASPSELVDARATYATLAARLDALAAASGAAGSAFPGAPASGDLFRRTDRAGAFYRWDGAAWVQLSIPRVTAFWATPSTDDRCYRSDRDLEYFYDGTRWLTTQVFEAVAAAGSLAGISVSTAIPLMPLHAGATDVWMIDFRWAYAVFTTHNASNYWRALLTKNNGAVETVLSTLVSDQVTLSNWQNPAATVIGAAVGTSDRVLYATFAKTGTPGLLTAVAALRYRLIG